MSTDVKGNTLVAPFAIWLIVASAVQFYYHASVLSLLVIAFCGCALMLLLLVWGFVFFGSYVVRMGMNKGEATQ